MHEPDPGTPVMLDEYGDPFECQVIVAKLRGEGIESSTAASTARGGVRLNAGNIVWVRRGDLERARAVVGGSA